MFNRILKYGLIAGVIAGVPTFTIPWQFAHRIPDSWAMAIGYLTMLIALSAVFLAIREQRAAQGGVIKFLPALALGLGISIVAGILYVLAWEAVLAVTGWDFAGDYARALIAQQKAKGVSGPALEKFVAGMNKFRRDYDNPFYRMSMTFTEIFPVGILVSLISAALLRNRAILPVHHKPPA